MKGKQLSHLCKEASEKNLPFLVRRGEVIQLKWVEPPRPQASFGLINDWVAVGNNVRGTFAKLIIPFRPEQLGWVRRETLRLFRFDTKKNSFEKLNGLLPHPKHAVIYATIEQPGIYGLIGLHTHPLVQETIRLLCEMKPVVLALPRHAQHAVRDRVCEPSSPAPQTHGSCPRGDTLVDHGPTWKNFSVGRLRPRSNDQF